MATVVVKGENAYQCDVCNRSIRVPANKEGLDIIQRCIITNGCQGKLHRLTLMKDVINAPAFPPEVSGVQDWAQRKVLYTHKQPIAAATWTVQHDLANKPVLHTYANRYVGGVLTLVATEPKTVRTIDINTLELTFNFAESGLVQCVALSGQNKTNPGAAVAAVASTAPIQITTDLGEITVATLNSTPVITISLSFIKTGQTELVNVEYLGVDNASINSPWVGADKLLANGKKYTVRSFNIVTTPLGPANFTQGNIVNGSTFFISAVNGVPIKPADALILLGKSPYASVDRIYDTYIETFNVNKIAPELFYSDGKAFARPSIIKNIYPRLLVV